MASGLERVADQVAWSFLSLEHSQDNHRPQREGDGEEVEEVVALADHGISPAK
jgi:hypothetical protein